MALLPVIWVSISNSAERFLLSRLSLPFSETLPISYPHYPTLKGRVMATVPATTVVTNTPAPKRAPNTSSGRDAVTPAKEEKMSESMIWINNYSVSI
jgi:hypothetical protein